MNHRAGQIAFAAIVGGVLISSAAATISWRDSISPLGRKLFSFSTTLDIDDLSKPGGRIFRAVSSDNRFACAAHFVYSVASRMVTNSNQVEFFCREANKAPQVSFERIESIDSREISKSDILFFDGKVIDLNNAVSITPANKTKSIARLDGFRNGRVYYISRKKDGSYLFFSHGHKIRDKTCPGMSISDEEGYYYGSIVMSSYVSYFNDRALFDLNGALYATDALEQRAECSMLKTTQVVDGVGWPYGGIRTAKGFLVGGSGFPARLYEVSPDLSTRTVTVDAPPAFVSEIYSYLPLRNRVLVGTFPSGHPFSVANDGRSPAIKTNYFPLREPHWRYPDTGAPYRELQAMANSYGALWGGMYPWGELFVNDQLSDSLKNYRLFSHPTYSASLKAPYASEAGRQVSDFWAGRFDDVSEFAEARHQFSKNDELPRELGLFRDAWGQRIQQIVIRNGAICASTGSMAQTPYEPAVHKHLTPEQYGEYGTVWCADLPGQALADIEKPGSYPVEFAVFERGVSIKIGAEAIERVTQINEDIEAAFTSRPPIIEGAAPVVLTEG